MKTIALILALLALALPARPQGGTVTLAWNKNPEPDIAGYIIYGGTSPRTYTLSTNVGNVTRATVQLVGARTNYYALTAVSTCGLESDFSSEVTNVAPVVRPRRFMIVTGLESSPDPDGTNWTEVLSTHVPVTMLTNLFYRPKLSVQELPPKPEE